MANRLKKVIEEVKTKSLVNVAAIILKHIPSYQLFYF